jgi:hypothetical protein
MGSGLAILITCLCLHALPAQSQQAPNSQTSQDEVVFVPPETGAPADRVGAGTRDFEREGRGLVLLAPPGGGLTTLPKAPLVWHISQTFSGRMEAEIVSVNRSQTGVMKITEGRFRKGYYALDLARSAMALEPGHIYKWTVTLIARQTGQIEDRQETYVEVVPLSSAPTATDAKSRAAAGLWFDALAPFVEIGLSGKVRLTKTTGFAQLTTSAGLKVP